ncbi:MAG: hypothetical protein NY202_02600 [Mollicutes bacterium UO1]
MLTTIIEGINEIRKEVSGTSSRKLKRTETNELLGKVKTGLEKLEQNAEETPYKEIVKQKVKELKAVADKNIEEEPD